MKDNATLGWSFPVKVNPATGRIQTTDSNNDIKQSILILLKTYKGERFYHPSYGSNINKYMFEPASRTLIKSMKTEIARTIGRWEKRAENVSVDVYNTKESETMLIVNIKYNIKGSSGVEEFNYAMDLLEN